MRSRVPPLLAVLLALAGCDKRGQEPARPADDGTVQVTPGATSSIDEADARFKEEAWAAALEIYDARWQEGAPVRIRSRVQAAIAAVKLGDEERAFVWIERAFAAGAQPRLLARAPELAELVEDPRWQDLAEAHADVCAAEARRQFDFWVGEWEVVDGEGNRLGNNRIDRGLGGCALVERWVGAGGGRGRSLNFYDPSIDRWRQEWVDERGRLISYVGGIEAGAMVFAGKMILSDGTSLRTRMTLQPEGAYVRQTIETSADGGDTWEPWFEGIYRPLGRARGDLDAAEAAEAEKDKAAEAAKQAEAAAKARATSETEATSAPTEGATEGADAPSGG
ncbi:MAG: hypothetical protein KC486_29700 [Myxococcales bacterium]|nr:hypothetical protein [Myxococcales bacterium]